MTDVNYFGEEKTTSPGSSKNSGGILIGLGLAGAGLVWYFLTKKNAVTASQTPDGASYGESITGGSGSEDLPAAPAPVDPFQTTYIKDAVTNWWNSLFPAPGAVPASANTNDAMLTKLADARLSTDKNGNAAETLFAAMQKNPEAVTTVKLPFVVKPTPAETNAAVLNMLKGATVSQKTTGNAAETLFAAMQAQPASAYVPSSGAGTSKVVDGTKVTVGSYDYVGASGQKYETPKNGTGYSSGSGMTVIAGNVAAGIAHEEAKRSASVPSAKSSPVATVRLPFVVKPTTPAAKPAAPSAKLASVPVYNPVAAVGSAVNAFMSALTGRR